MSEKLFGGLSLDSIEGVTLMMEEMKLEEPNTSMVGALVARIRELEKALEKVERIAVGDPDVFPHSEGYKVSEIIKVTRKARGE